MAEVAIALSIAQIATVAFVLWPAFRMISKAGYSNRQAWVVVACSLVMAGFGLAMSLMLAYVGWFSFCAPFGILGLIMIGLVGFGLSPFTLSAVPILYLSFGRRPVGTHSSDIDAFG
jgi:hypothetical protein